MTPPKTDLRQQRRTIRPRVYYASALGALTVLAILVIPGKERLRAAGPPNTGHEQLTCAQCHTPADGTLRQQIQANARHLVGLRSVGTDFVHKPVGNVDCLACHQNDDDRHPVYRFNEPRFAEARDSIAPQLCVSCHTEHSGRRVTVEPTSCSVCHADMTLNDDPIEPSHEALVVAKDWGSCLSCHDFHGNHVRTTPTLRADGASDLDIARYLAGGPEIYGTMKHVNARTEREMP